MDQNYAGSIYRRSFTKSPHFVLIRLQVSPPREILVSDWLIVKKSPLNSLGQMGPNYAGNLSIVSPLQSFLISSESDNKHGCHGQFLCLIGWYFKNILLWKHLAKWNQTIQEASMEALYKVFSFRLDWATNMVATVNSYFWLAEISKIFSETTHPN